MLLLCVICLLFAWLLLFFADVSITSFLIFKTGMAENHKKINTMHQSRSKQNHFMKKVVLFSLLLEACPVCHILKLLLQHTDVLQIAYIVCIISDL